MYSAPRFKDAEVAVLDNVIPREAAAVHGNVDALGQGLCRGEGAAEVEEAVGAAEPVRHHRTGEDDGLAPDVGGEAAGGGDHGVGAVRHNDARPGREKAQEAQNKAGSFMCLLCLLAAELLRLWLRRAVWADFALDSSAALFTLASCAVLV